MKGRFYEEVECVFDKFAEYQITIMLGDFNAKVVGKTFSNQQMGMRV
jgi:hypothetical protein